MAPLIPFEIPAFRAKYQIPDDVEVHVVGVDEPLIGTTECILIHTRAITKGGVCFPLDPLLLCVLSAMKLCPIQCCPNFFRIVMGVPVLNRLLNLSLGHWEILYCYIIKSAGGNYYLVVRKKDRYLVTHLPDLNKGYENDVVFVSGNWEYAAGVTPSYQCPYEEGAPGETVNGKIPERAVKMEELKKVWDYNDSLFCRAAHTLLGYTPTYMPFIVVPPRPNSALADDLQAIQTARDQTPRSCKKSLPVPSGRNGSVRNFLDFLSTVKPSVPVKSSGPIDPPTSSNPVLVEELESEAPIEAIPSEQMWSVC